MGKRTEVVTLNLSKSEKKIIKDATVIVGKKYPATLAKEITLKVAKEIIANKENK